MKEVYGLIIDKCLRMDLIKSDENIQVILNSIIDESDMDNQIAQLLVPAINKLLNRNIYDLYQVLEFIDVREEYIKEKIMDVENAGIIPSVIAFAIIDRLKARYLNYQLLSHSALRGSNGRTVPTLHTLP